MGMGLDDVSVYQVMGLVGGQRLPTVNISQAWLCLGIAARFQSKALKLNKFLKLSAITVNKKKTVRQTQIERERERERERDACVTLVIE